MVRVGLMVSIEIRGSGLVGPVRLPGLPDPSGTPSESRGRHQTFFEDLIDFGRYSSSKTLQIQTAGLWVSDLEGVQLSALLLRLRLREASERFVL
ncbi:hypothetical protein VZT92_012421 [Zoarces viviparus]|uniref:Uncharacterized protein n=1 Tax=Zoarces viviparus TaxID=48416 RepID=A0AAW1FBQ5_ZOAVI